MRGMDCNCLGSPPYYGYGMGAAVPQLPSVYTGFFNSSTFNNIVAGTTFLAPAVGTALQSAMSIFATIANAFGIGSGRQEADIIVPVQNAIAARLNSIDMQVGHDAMGTTDLTLLNNVYQELKQTGQYFLQFISDKSTFSDGRASQQAANTIMPLIDGTGNYVWPQMVGTPVTADQWGNPTNGGRMGAVARRIQSLGGTLPTGTSTIQGTPLPGVTITPTGLLSSPLMLVAVAAGVFLLLKK